MDYIFNLSGADISSLLTTLCYGALASSLHIDIRTFRYLMISKAVVDISILDCWSWEITLSSTPQLKCAGSARSHHASCSNWRAIKTFTMFSVNYIHRMGRREDRISRYRRKFSRVFHNILSSSMRQGDLVLAKFLEACQWWSVKFVDKCDSANKCFQHTREICRHL